jgi:hypothetical protein
MIELKIAFFILITAITSKILNYISHRDEAFSFTILLISSILFCIGLGLLGYEILGNQSLANGLGLTFISISIALSVLRIPY